MRELSPAARGSQEAGLTQPRARLLAHPCNSSTDFQFNVNVSLTLNTCHRIGSSEGRGCHRRRRRQGVRNDQILFFRLEPHRLRMRGRHHRGGGAEVLRSGAARDAEVLKLSGGGGSGGRGGSPGTGSGTGEVEGRQGRRGAASRGSWGSVAALSSALPLNVVRCEAWEH